MTEDRVFEMVSKAQEFDQIKVSSNWMMYLWDFTCICSILRYCLADVNDLSPFTTL